LANRQKGREKEGREHLYDETVANAATYPVDVGAGHRKTYNLMDGDRARRCAKRASSTYFHGPPLLPGSLSERRRYPLNSHAISVANLHA